MRLGHITPKNFYGVYDATCNATRKYTRLIKNLSKLLVIRAGDIAFVPTSFPGGNSEREPPDPISNSEVKTLSADGSVGSPHVRVGHRQDLNSKSRSFPGTAFFVSDAWRELHVVQGF